MKSCTRTSSGWPLGRSSRPAFLKSPISSFFLVSTEIAGWPVRRKRPTHGIDVLELGVAVGMLAALAGLGVGLQAEAHVLQQPADHGVVDAIARRPIASARCRWLRLTHSSAACGSPRIADEISSRQRLQQAGLLDHGGLAAAAAAPDPAARPSRRRAVEVAQAAPDRAARDPGRSRTPPRCRRGLPRAPRWPRTDASRAHRDAGQRLHSADE